MERAAHALTEAIINRWDNGTPVTVFAGPGNNGGDALAVARMMAEKGYKVSFSLQHQRRTFTGLPSQQRTGEIMDEITFTKSVPNLLLPL